MAPPCVGKSRAISSDSLEKQSMPVLIWGSYQQTVADDRRHTVNLTYLIMYSILRRHVSEFSSDPCFGTPGQLGAAKKPLVYNINASLAVDILVNSSFGFQQTLVSALLTSGPECGSSRSQTEQSGGLTGLQRRV